MSYKFNPLSRFGFDPVQTENNFTGPEKEAVSTIPEKQDKLVSGQNIKTVNGNDITGPGDVVIASTGAAVVQNTGTSETAVMSQKSVTENFEKKEIGANIYDGSFVKTSPWVGYIAVWHSDYLNVTSSTLYVISGLDYLSLQYYQIGFFDANKTKISNSNPSNSVDSNIKTFTTPENCAYIIICFEKTGGDLADISSLQIEVGPKKSVLKPHKYLKNYVLLSQYIYDLGLKVENISNLPEVSISNKNLYNPYSRVKIGERLGRNVYMSDFIEVVENEDYYYTRPDCGNAYFYEVYDENKNKTRSFLYPNIKILPGEKYVRLHQCTTGTSTEFQLDSFEKITVPCQLEKSKYPTAFHPYYTLTDYITRDEILKKTKSSLKGKICYYLGDSITNGGHWTSVVHAELEFANKDNRSGNLGFDGAQWTDTLNSGTSTANNIKERIDALENAVVSTGILPDIIIIALGTNDWGNNKPIGDYATTMAKIYADVQSRTTLYDAIKYGITRIRKLYPNAFITIVTPIQRAGKYDTDYIDAIIKGAKMMSVPCIDAYSNSGLIPYDEWLTLYYQDGLHETALGGQVHGKYISNELQNLFYKK